MQVFKIGKCSENINPL